VFDANGELRRERDDGEAEERIDPSGGPGAEDGGVGGLAGFEQIFGALFVLFEARSRRERECVVRIGKHTKLLSTAPGVRTRSG
jgi:hypothetical protein